MNTIIKKINQEIKDTTSYFVHDYGAILKDMYEPEEIEKMADAYLDNGFWIDLPIMAEYVLENK